MKNSSGLTLIELMLALTLSIIILSVCSSVYCISQKNLQTQMALAQLQENARIAQAFLQTSIHLAGFMGCAKYSSSEAITYDEHKLTIKHASVTAALLTQEISGGVILHTTLAPKFSAENILVISNCKQAEIIKVDKVFTTATEQILTVSAPLEFKFKKNADVAKLERDTFSIEKSSHSDKEGKPLFGLYRTDIKNQKIELVEGVNQMQIQLQSEGLAIELELFYPGINKKWYSYIALAH